MSELTGLRVAVLATDGFEETELTEPLKALERRAQVTIVSLSRRHPGSSHDIDKTLKVEVDRTLDDVSAEEFDAVHLPGGTLNADAMRTVRRSSVPAGDAGRRQADRGHLSRALGTGVGGPGAGSDADQLPQHPGRRPQRGRHWVDREVVEDGNG